MTRALLQVEDLAVTYAGRNGPVRAVDGVGFHIMPGETLGFVGESGCGKTSLGRAVMRLLEPSAGRILLDGTDITRLSRRAMLPLRSRMQIIFQDPFASLNPRLTVGRILEEPFIVHHRGDATERRASVAALLDRVGLTAAQAVRYPHEFSGGQRQRIAIARALALSPSLVVCDEPVSSLDVSIQAQILDLLRNLQAERSLAYLFITHDLSVLGTIADRVAVMYLGQIVEMADRVTLRRRPLHPYTRALFSAVPTTDRAARAREPRIRLEGEPGSPSNPPPGCRFHTRCAHAADICRQSVPSLEPIAGGGVVACHLVKRGPDLQGTPPWETTA